MPESDKKSEKEIQFARSIDKLFLDYRSNDNVKKLEELIELTNGVLFELILAFIQDKEIIEDVLDDVYRELVVSKNTFNLNERSILYELYLIAKNCIKAYRKK